MRAAALEQTVGATLVPVEDEIFAENSHRPDRPLGELVNRRDRHPVSPQKLADGSARADLRQRLGVLSIEHCGLLP